MVIIRVKEIRSLELKDLEKRLGELYLELAKEKASIAVGGTVKNPGRVGEIKRTIARILTIRKDLKKKEVSK